MLKGYIVAIVTPFKNGKIDVSALEKYIDYIANSGVSGIVVCGSTGESLSLSIQEKTEMARITSSINSGRTRVIGGVVNSTTDDCIELIKKTEKYVEDFLCICPFYVKPLPQQIYYHFEKLSNATSRGIILYNNPGRVGVNINFDTFRRLCDLENIVAIKECASDLSRFSLWRSVVREGFSFLTGNDDVACGALAMGARGVISVSANIAPVLCVKMYDTFVQNDLEKFGILRDSLAPLHELMFREPSPAPVKYALSRLKIISNELRGPLLPIGAELQAQIDDLMDKLELI
jgi:4-hydroxy-tetrahydrodipicolinate synthase